MNSNPTSSEQARQLIRNSEKIKNGLDPGLSSRYGLTILIGSILQILLLSTATVFLAFYWTWESLVLFAGFGASLSYFWTKAEARNRTIIPHGGKKLESFAQKWHAAWSLAGVVVIGIAAGRVGLPVSWNATGQGLGWMALLSGILLVTAAIPTIVFAVHLIRKGKRL